MNDCKWMDIATATHWMHLPAAPPRPVQLEIAAADEQQFAPDARAVLDAVRAFSHMLDDAAQGITEQQVYDLATELRVLIGIDGEEAAQAASKVLADRQAGGAP